MQALDVGGGFGFLESGERLLAEPLHQILLPAPKLDGCLFQATAARGAAFVAGIVQLVKAVQQGFRFLKSPHGGELDRAGGPGVPVDGAACIAGVLFHELAHRVVELAADPEKRRVHVGILFAESGAQEGGLIVVGGIGPGARRHGSIAQLFQLRHELRGEGVVFGAHEQRGGFDPLAAGSHRQELFGVHDSDTVAE